jgi:PAS domain S-box-containing protein
VSKDNEKARKGRRTEVGKQVMDLGNSKQRRPAPMLTGDGMPIFPGQPEVSFDNAPGGGAYSPQPALQFPDKRCAPMKKKRTTKTEKHPARAPARQRAKRKPPVAVPSSPTTPDLFRLVFDKINDAAFLAEMNADGTPGMFIDANDAACRRLGYSRDELLRMGPADINEPGTLEPAAVVESARRDGGAIFERVHVAKDGRKIPVEISTRMVRLEGREVAVSIVRDVAERKQAERALEGAIEDLGRSQAETAALLEGARAVLTPGTFLDAAKAIFDAAKKATGASAGYVAILSADGRFNEVVYLDTGGLRCSIPQGVPMPIRGLREQAYKTMVPVICNDFPGSSFEKVLPEGHLSIKNVLFAPMFLDEKPVGLLGLANKRGGFDESGARLATAFGELAAVALKNSRAFERLKESEERFRAVTTTTLDAVILSDADGRISSWNRGAESIFGYTEAEAKGQPIEVLLPKSLVSEHRKGWERLRSGQATKATGKILECTGRRKDGTEFPIELSHFRWTLAGQPNYGTIIRDISERKTAEEELKKHRDFLSQMVDQRTAQLKASNESLTRVGETQAAVNALLELSLLERPIEEILEEALKMVLGIKWISVESRGCISVVEDEPDILVMKAQIGLGEPIRKACARLPFGRCLCGRAAQSGKVVFADRLDERHEVSYEGIVEHGHYCVPIVFEGRTLGVMNIYTAPGHVRNTAEEEFLTAIANALSGIMARKRAELDWQRADQRYSTLAEAARDAIFILSPDRRILYVNKFAAAELGKTPIEVVGKTKEEAGLAILSDEDPEKFAALFARGEGFSEEILVRFPTGERWLSIAFSAIRGERGQVESALGIARDVTERRRLEEQLTQAQKLESIGQLAGGVAHDFNNLLSVIISYTGFVYDELPKDSKFRTDLDEVRKAADRATALTRQLLAFSRKQAITPREVLVKDSVGNLAKMLKRLIGEHVALDIRIAENTGVLFIDPSQLEQVIVNLVVNARDAMPGGGKLVIEAKNVTLGAEQVADAPDVETGDYVMLAVTDTGTGIPREILPKIFEPFFTTKEKGKGTGLGLSMVYGIVKQNKGHIEIESVVGTGTVFRVFFKRSRREGAGRADAAQPELPRGRGETILLVEDEDIVRGSIARMLKGAGYAVIEATGGAAGLDRFRENRAGIAAVLTDVIMPGMGGAALALEIKKLDSTARVLFCSGYPDEMAGAQGTLPPGTVLVAKPVDKAELLTKLREVLDRK